MPTTAKPRRTAGISDDAVKAATGRDWTQWLALIDKAGGRKLDHKAIVAIVNKNGIGPWWQQMVTVGYEQARGLRDKHQKPGGYSISRSKTLAVPVSNLFRAWSDRRTRASWLKDPAVTVRKATANKSMRITWVDGHTNVEVNFYSKGAGKSQVSVQHDKLPDAKSGERMKAYWGTALDRLAKVAGSA